MGDKKIFKDIYGVSVSEEEKGKMGMELLHKVIYENIPNLRYPDKGNSENST